MEESKETEVKKPRIEVTYQKAKFHRRIFADLLDLIIFALVWILLFLGVRGIVMSTSSYKEVSERANKTRLDSGLYRESEGTLITIATYVDNSSSSLSGKEKADIYRSSIDTLISYLSSEVGEEAGNEARNDFYTYCLDQNYNDIPYFVLEDNNLSFNEDCMATYNDYASVYRNYIDDNAMGLLSRLDSQYLSDTNRISNDLLYIEIPVATVIGLLLVYYLPGLVFFRRGRCTIGKKAYHIGRVDSSLLNVSIGRYTAESMILIFGIFFLSLYTLGIPLIISFSMMAFSKNKQDFPDYMLGIHEIDTSRNKIYYSKAEAYVEQLDNSKTAVDFTPESRL